MLTIFGDGGWLDVLYSFKFNELILPSALQRLSRFSCGRSAGSQFNNVALIRNVIFVCLCACASLGQSDCLLLIIN